MSTAQRPRRRVAVFSPNQSSPSETFVRAHIERLPFETVHIYGGGWQRRGTSGWVWPILRYPGWAIGKVAPAAGRTLFARALAHKLRRLKIDVALAEYGMTGAEIQDACRLARVPLVVYFYGFDAFSRSILEEYLPEYRRMFDSAAAIIAVSDTIRKRLDEWGAPPERTPHLVCGVDPLRFHGAAPADAQPHFVAVGRFVEKKAPHLTVLAFRDVFAAHPSARLSMVGDGALLGPTRRLAAALGLEESIEFLGVQAPEAVAALLRTARAFVQHSLVAEDGDSEGTPVGILEAQMSGLPVVSTFHSGIPEVVEDGVTGLLVREGDAAGMGKMMSRLASDPVLAGQMGTQARERALQLFALDTHLAKLAEILEQAAGRQCVLPAKRIPGDSDVGAGN